MPLMARKLNLGEDKAAELRQLLDRRIDACEQGTNQLFTQDIPRWRKVYDGTPEKPVRTFPWYRSSNVVVPLVAIHTDTLLARITSIIFQTDPLFTFKVFGTIPLIGQDGKPQSTVKDDLEMLFNLCSVEDSELNMYPLVRDWLFETFKVGTGVIKAPHETEWEWVVEPFKGEQKRIKKWDGPRPQRVQTTNFLVWPLNISDLRQAKFKAQIIPELDKDDFLQRGYMGIYDQEAVLKLVKSSIIQQSSPDTQKQEQVAKVRTLDRQDIKIYECWLKFELEEGRYFNIIATYHKETRTLLRTIFNPYATGDDIDDVFVGSRLFLRDDMWYGKGYAEVLAGMQEEASTIHNQRRDNATIANTVVWVVKKNAFLDMSFPIMPGKPIIVDQMDDVKPEQLGSPTEFAFQEEANTMDLTERRSGISPPMIGYGAGAMGGKRGVYSASGTMAMMQEGNLRQDLNLMDARAAIGRIGRIIHKGWLLGGLSERTLQKFGERAADIKQSVQMYPFTSMSLTASKASVNREVEKQSSLMLAQTMGTYYEKITMLFQQIVSTNNPEIQDFMRSVYSASSTLMRNILKGFESPDAERLLPQLPAKPQNAGGAPPPGQPGAPPPDVQQQGMGGPPGLPPPIGPNGAGLPGQPG